MQTNSVVLARKRTTPTERLSLVGEVSANFLRIEVSSRGQPNGFLDRNLFTMMG
jgi:hypothetical protein